MEREATILIVDDEAEVREVLVQYFAAQGYVALATENASAAPIQVATRHDPALEAVRITVADSGPGIPPELRARVFEP